ncbi:MAG: hypothetical protein H0Z35_11710 [Thermoanaerobacteraceae bacterium]|nr:hypothetical protein [Thermoanaerobacteraceae bacterium]
MSVGAPKEENLEAYDKLTSEGITVYLPSALKISPQGLVISLGGMIFKRLQVSGVKV